MAKIKSVTLIGKEQTYDIEVDHPDHQFYLANGILTSNSHAVSYAFDSYFCSWLFYKYPKEWLCAWLESAESDPKEKSKAISSIKSFGYDVAKLDINLSERNWTITDDGRIMPSFKSVKGIGDSAIDEILRNRPYNALRDFLWDDFGKWRHSKLNKRCFDVLTKLSAFDSMKIVGDDKEIKNYRQLNHILVERMQDLKKKGPEFLQEVIEESKHIVDWTPTEKTDFSNDLAGIITIEHVIDQNTQNKLSKAGVSPISDFIEKSNDGDVGLVWFILESSESKMSKKNKEYQLFTVIDSSGSSQKLFVWSTQGKSYEKNKLYICELKKSDFISTSAYKIKKVDS